VLLGDNARMYDGQAILLHVQLLLLLLLLWLLVQCVHFTNQCHEHCTALQFLRC
jgi:hypothetical protein